jgi:hypothetical protein|tara:strand:+ start:326 stop:805 length:480 start_codon:yes stop_codon:yes gene_type:complete
MSQFKQLFISFFLIFNFSIRAQEVISSSGLNSNGAGGVISYSVGQVAVDFNIANNGSVNMGVQQPYEIYSTIGIETENINLNLVAYPNPTNDKLVLFIEDLKSENFSLQLFNLEGKLLMNKECVDNETIINLKIYPTNTYLLTIFKDQLIIKNFRIIKN